MESQASQASFRQRGDHIGWPSCFSISCQSHVHLSTVPRNMGTFPLQGSQHLMQSMPVGHWCNHPNCRVDLAVIAHSALPSPLKPCSDNATPHIHPRQSCRFSSVFHWHFRLITHPCPPLCRLKQPNLQEKTPYGLYSLVPHEITIIT